jgi:hypothetical protein
MMARPSRQKYKKIPSIPEFEKIKIKIFLINI